MEDEKVMTVKEALEGIRTALVEFEEILRNLESDLFYEGEQGGAMSLHDALHDLGVIIGDKYTYGGGHGFLYEMWKAAQD